MLKSLFPWKHHKTKVMAAQQTMDDVVPEVNSQEQELHPCHVCGRTFLQTPLKKHERVCEKNLIKRRKPFDSLKQRVDGTDLAQFHQKSYLKKPEPAHTPDPKRKRENNWKEKHLELVNAIRAAKGVPTTAMSHPSPKAKSTTSLMAGTERCPSCDRQFGPKAYDRHVEWCKEKKAQQRIHQSPANVLLAKERLEARTKYVPPLNRSKKTAVREKYSNHNTSTETLNSVKSSPLSRGSSIRKPRSVINMGRSSEKNSNGDDGRERPKVEKNGRGHGDKLRLHEPVIERYVPVIASPSPKAESVKSFQKKRTLPFSKINSVNINNEVGGMTVSSLKYDVASKKMVTWKDTVKKQPEIIKVITEKKNVSKKPVNENVLKKVNKSSESGDGDFNSSQSINLGRTIERINCEKILSSNDVFYKEHSKLPHRIQKNSFTKKVLRDKHFEVNQQTEEDAQVVTEDVICTSSKSSEETIKINTSNSSCNSVTQAFEKLKINSREEIRYSKTYQDYKFHPTGTKHIPLKKEETFSKVKDPVNEINLQNDSPKLEESTVDANTSTNEHFEETFTIEEGINSSDIVPEYCDEFDYLKNSHKNFSNWFEDYIKEEEHEEAISKNEECTNVAGTNGGDSEVICENNCPENLVFLFKSTTNLDLTRDVSDETLTDKKPCDEKLEENDSEETIQTKYEIDSIDLDFGKVSNFSLRKSVSDIDINNAPSIFGTTSKNTIVSIFSYKNKENFDTESVSCSRKIRINSLPNIQFVEFTVKDGMPKCNKVKINKNEAVSSNVSKETIRRKILEIAANQFVEDFYVNEKNKNMQSANRNLKFPEEEYTVPKKRRKVESTSNKNSTVECRKFNYFTSYENFDLEKFKALTISENTGNKNCQINKSNVLDKNAMGDYLKKENKVPDTELNTNCMELSPISNTFPKSKNSSANSFISEDYSPRVLTLIDKILNTNVTSSINLDDSSNLIVITPSDCLRLVDLDKNKLPKIEKCLKKIKNKYKKESSIILPAIKNEIEDVSKQDKEIQVVLNKDENVLLPKIMDRRLLRGETRKYVKKGVNDVYFEYDSKSNPNYDPFESAQRQFMELLECDDFKSLTPTATSPVQHTPRPHTTSTATPIKQSSPVTKKKTVKSATPKLTKVQKKTNRASVIDPPISFKDSLESFTDDFELMENLINDQFTDNNKNSFYLHLKSEKNSLGLGDILDNRKYSDDMSSIDPRLINENDNLSIPEHFKIEDYSPTSTTDTDITLQNDIDHYSIQYDNKIAAIEPKIVVEPKKNDKTPAKPTTEKKPQVKRSVSLVSRSKTDTTPKVTNKKLTTKAKLTSKSVSSIAATKVTSSEKKKGLSTLKRSMTLFEPVPKPPPLKNKNDVNNYFSEQEQKLSVNTDRSSPEKEVNESLEETLKPEELFSVDDEMYEEYKKYEEMYLKEKSQKNSTKKHKPKIVDINFGILTNSEEEEHSAPFNNKISNDSAYGSLTRKSPKTKSRTTKLTPLEQKQVDSTSSSGSENCPNSPDTCQRFSKFCHECGNRYPLTTAKFCVECGVKRLVL